MRKKIALFGAGDYGVKALKYYGADNVQYFIDNNSEKSGQELLGKPIVNLDEYLRFKERYTVIISSSYYLEISEQLERSGIKGYRYFFPATPGHSRVRWFVARAISAIIPFRKARCLVRYIIERGFIRYLFLTINPRFGEKIIEFGILRYFWRIAIEPYCNPKHFISIAAIMKNEGQYLVEWIEYHRLVGVNKFYIYDNESTDDTKEILKPYIESGIVTYLFWPGTSQQMPAYRDAAIRHKHDTKWLAYIDIDEFLIPLGKQSVVEVLRSLPKNAAALLVPWRLFGSSGHIRKPKGLVIENYKMRWRDPSYDKCIVNPRLLCELSILTGTPHYIPVCGRIMDENGVYVPFRGLYRPEYFQKNGIPFPVFEKIALHHYVTKSREEYFANKIPKGRVYDGESIHQPSIGDYFKHYDRNEVRDDTMDKYIEPLRKKVIDKEVL